MKGWTEPAAENGRRRPSRPQVQFRAQRETGPLLPSIVKDVLVFLAVVIAGGAFFFEVLCLVIPQR